MTTNTEMDQLLSLRRDVSVARDTAACTVAQALVEGSSSRKQEVQDALARYRDAVKELGRIGRLINAMGGEPYESFAARR
jgi:hypothetical protein